MIYFVDEDIRQLKPFRIELEMRGFKVITIANADDAYNILSKVDDIDLVILDVMLAASTQENSRYDRESTNNFLETGITLLKELSKLNNKFFPKKVVLYSMASNRDIVSKIRKTAEEFGIEYLKKKDYLSSYAFGEKIENIIKSIGTTI